MDDGDLLSDYGQHLDVDPVELVETSPRSARRQPFEELRHSHVVELVGAVEHHALDRERLR